jgi:hypothetical protein
MLCIHVCDTKSGVFFSLKFMLVWFESILNTLNYTQLLFFKFSLAGQGLAVLSGAAQPERFMAFLSGPFPISKV